MAEKVLEFEAGTSGDALTAGTSAPSGLNFIGPGTTPGTGIFDASASWYGGNGISLLNVAGNIYTVREFIDAAGATLATTNARMSYTWAVELPSTVPTENETFWQVRLLPSAGGPKIYYGTDGAIKFQDSTGAGTVVIVSATNRAALASQRFRATITIDASASLTAAPYSIKIYNNAGTQVGTAVIGTVLVSSTGAGMAGQELGRIGGITAARTYKFDHVGLSDGVLTEIAAGSSRLASPVLTIVSTTNPTTIGGSNGAVMVSWPAVSGATRYDAYKATTAGTPGQSDFTLYASGVTSPYEFTGQNAGSDWYGIMAVA